MLERTADFDPYCHWLGIGPSDEPPSYYALLGLPEFEGDTTRLAAAARHRRGQLDPHRDGPFADACERLLAEIEEARACLADPVRRDAYDARLRMSRLLMPETRDLFRKRIRDQQRDGARSAGPFEWTGSHPSPRMGSDGAAARPVPASQANSGADGTGILAVGVAGRDGGPTPTPGPQRLADAPASPEAWPTHPQYEFLQEIGQGSAATVYEAYDRALERYVAIKVLRQELRDDPRQSEGFWSEVRFLAGLAHDHVVQVFTIDEPRGWVIMELMQGTLAAKTANAPLGPEVVRSVLWQALQGLSFLHRRGKLHGEIKPAALLVNEEGRVKLSDSTGVAADGEFRAPKPTQKHVAPELLNPDVFGPVGPGVDLYCLGFTAFELLKGPGFDALFKGVAGDGDSDPMAWMRWHGSPSERLPSVRDVMPKVPEDLVRVIDRMLCKEVSGRYASAEEALHDLRDSPLLPVGGPPPAPLEPGANGAVVATPPAFYSPAPAVSHHTAPTLLDRLRDPDGRRELLRNRGVLSCVLGIIGLVVGLAVIGPPGQDRAARSERLVFIESAPPGAAVRVNGRIGSTTPAELRLPAGTHRLALSLEGFEPLEAEFQVQPGRDRQVLDVYRLTRLDPPGEEPLVRIASEPPGAEIEIGGLAVGRSTPSDVRLAPGLYDLTLRKTGHQELTTQIAVRSGDPEQVFDGFRLAPAEVTVVIDSDPAGAAIRLNGRATNDVTPARLVLAPGSYTLELAKPDYRPLIRHLVVPAGEETHESRGNVLEPLERRPKEFLLSIASTPPGAAVLVNGRRYDALTPTGVRLAEGRHLVELRRAGYQLHSEAVTLRSGDAELTARLTPQRTTEVHAADVRTVWELPAHLGPGKRLLYAQHVRGMLIDDWSAGPREGVSRAAHRFQAARAIWAADARLYCAYGLLLTRHHRPSEAVAHFQRGVELERQRFDARQPGARHGPDFSVWRQLIQARAALKQREHLERAAADCVDLLQRAAAVVSDATADQAVAVAVLADNARFAGTIFGFLQGPAGTRTSPTVPFDEYEAAIRRALEPHGAWQIWSDSRDQVLDQYASSRQSGGRPEAKLHAGRTGTLSSYLPAGLEGLRRELLERCPRDANR